jgi:hypothetical protein
VTRLVQLPALVLYPGGTAWRRVTAPGSRSKYKKERDSAIRYIHKQGKGRAFEKIMGNKLPSVPHRSVLVTRFACRRTLLPTATPEQNWIKGSPLPLLCPQCGDAEEIDLDHVQRCQRVSDAMDNGNNQDTRWKFSK